MKTNTSFPSFLSLPSFSLKNNEIDRLVEGFPSSLFSLTVTSYSSERGKERESERAEVIREKGDEGASGQKMMEKETKKLRNL